MIVRVLGAVLAVCVLGVACDSDGPTIRTSFSTTPPHSVVGPAASGSDPYTLDVLDGAKTVQIAEADLHGQLYRISTPVGTPPVPSAHVAGRTANVTLTGGGDAELTITLDRGVAWNLRFSAGITTVSADLSNGVLAGLTAVQGISTIEVTAAAPTSKVTLSELAGVSVFALHTTKVSPVTALLRAGAGTVSIYGQVHSGVSGGTRLESPYTGPSSYTIDAVGGLSSLTVDTAH